MVGDTGKSNAKNDEEKLSSSSEIKAKITDPLLNNCGDLKGEDNGENGINAEAEVSAAAVEDAGVKVEKERSALAKKRGKRMVRLDSVPKEEFLLPPLARQDTEDDLEVKASSASSSQPPVSPRTIAGGMASAFNIVRKVSNRVGSKKQGKNLLPI